MTVAAAVHLAQGRRWGGGIALWGSAAVAALAVHAGFVAWAMRTPPVRPADPGPPAAVMLDLAPTPVAEELAEPEISKDTFDAQEILPPSPAAPPPEAPPPPDVADAPEIPIPQDLPVADLPPVEVPRAEVAVARPMSRPEQIEFIQPPEPEPEPEPTRARAEPQPQRQPPTEQQPSQAARKATAQAPQADRTAAAQNSRGGAGAAAMANWQSRLLAHLERNKRYPSASRARRENGIAHVTFSIDENGRVLSARLTKSSGEPRLDEEAVALFRRASPLPAPPAGANRSITAPIVFQIN